MNFFSSNKKQSFATTTNATAGGSLLLSHAALLCLALVAFGPLGQVNAQPPAVIIASVGTSCPTDFAEASSEGLCKAAHTWQVDNGFGTPPTYGVASLSTTRPLSCVFDGTGNAMYWNTDTSGTPSDTSYLKVCIDRKYS